MTHEFPLLDLTGNFPVKSVFDPKTVSGVGWDTLGVFKVELMFWSCWFIWPMALSGVSFKCLLIASSVRPGQVIRCPFLLPVTLQIFLD
jgi:hypothetical protein